MTFFLLPLDTSMLAAFHWGQAQVAAAIFGLITRGQLAWQPTHQRNNEMDPDMCKAKIGC